MTQRGKDFKPKVDRKGTSIGRLQGFQKGSDETKNVSDGKMCRHLVEPVPSVVRPDCEKHIVGYNNAIIRLGRDLIGDPTDSDRKEVCYGPEGATQAGMIDLVVGVNSTEPYDVDSQQRPAATQTHAKADAARLYLSQRCKADKLFDLKNGKVGNVEARSAAVLKADGVRIIARNGIKLVTRTDNLNSAGSITKAITGIDLNAGNRPRGSMQPIPKGRNLKEGLETLAAAVGELNGIVKSMLTYQQEFNREIARHTHKSTFLLEEVFTSPPLLMAGVREDSVHTMMTGASLTMNRISLEFFKMNFLEQSSSKYINSRYNHTN
jgi:hypothetical protein|tara:strand:+ start:140 stop:1105 length:966 start_codon:yes stop_codon:yes gene_type:complete